MSAPDCPVLHGARVTLEPLVAAHAAGLFPLLADRATWRYTDDGPPASESALHARYRRLQARRSPDGSQAWLNWAIIAPPHGAIGFVQATIDLATVTAEIAYVVGPAFQARGLGGDAVAALVRYLHDDVRATRIAATVDERNVPSLRVLRRLGFAIEDDRDPRNLRFARNVIVSRTALRAPAKGTAMRIFVTGSTGFIGTALVGELIAAGHHVLGLTRSVAGVGVLENAGAEALHGDVNDPNVLRDGASRSDGVIHAAFNHDFSDFSSFVANCAADARVIGTLGAALAGSDRPLLITSGVGMGTPAPGEPALERVAPDPANPNPRVASELAAEPLVRDGVNVSVMRLSQVHDPAKQGLITYAVALAREKGVSAYVGDGGDRWAAVHLRDAARLYRLALERAEPGARYNAVAEEGVRFRDIAEAIGRSLHVPVKAIAAEESPAHFGMLSAFIGHDAPASSEYTRRTLGWNPAGPGLVADLDAMR